MDQDYGDTAMHMPPSPSINLPQGIAPADLLRQGISPDTLASLPSSLFETPDLQEIAVLFPQFDILDFIGKGGMGAVYKVRQRAIERTVALKILPCEIGCDPAFSGQFAREAKALAKLSHPNIVTLYDFGQSEELYYIVMEHVDGRNLHQLMQHGRITPKEALAIVSQICDALQYAHDRGIVHRDIKPENILIDREGRVKVADFGLAKLLGAGAQEGSMTGRVTVTPSDETLMMEGKIMGTPPYMAPEQFEHPAAVDHRADIYALGVVFYQMLTGELPSRPLSTPPSRNVEIDANLDGIVLKALQHNPTMRYSQASIMKTDVVAFATGSTNSRSRRKKTRMTIAALILAMLSLGGVIVGYSLDSRTQASPNDSADGHMPGFPLGIDPTEKDIQSIRESIVQTVGEALPESISLSRVMVSNDNFDPQIRDSHRQMGIRTKLYARLVLTEGGKEDVTMEIIVTESSEQAQRLCNGIAFPYAQQAGKVAVLFARREDLSDYDIALAMGRQLGLSLPQHQFHVSPD